MSSTCSLSPQPTSIRTAWSRASSRAATALMSRSCSTSTAIHRRCGRERPDRFHVKGYIEEGTTTTPYELLASNGVSRHDLAIEALRRARGWSSRGAELAARYVEERDAVRAELRRTGVDPAWITDWSWS